MLLFLFSGSLQSFGGVQFGIYVDCRQRLLSFCLKKVEGNGQYVQCFLIFCFFFEIRFRAIAESPKYNPRYTRFRVVRARVGGANKEPEHAISLFQPPGKFLTACMPLTFFFAGPPEMSFLKKKKKLKKLNKKKKKINILAKVPPCHVP